jgi:hypothetical protein
MTTPKRQRKSRKSPNKAKLEKRLAESKGLYFRRVLPGGCVVLQSDYWLARAALPQADASNALADCLQDPPQEPAPPVIPSDPKDRWLAELTFIAEKSRFRPGWVAHQFKAKFGFFPPRGMEINPIPPSDEVKAWVKERLAEYLAS